MYVAWRMRLAAAFALALAPGVAPAAVNVPGQEPLEKVDFERHVMGLFSKTGCNNASCHGSFQGKNGFRLSLFGYDPDKDFVTLTRDNVGRRINPIEPDQSLLLLKATGKIPHEGGVRFPADSWQYQTMRSWIAAGTPWTKGSGAVQALKLDVGAFVFVPKGKNHTLKITAKFADGSEEDVTAFCDYRIADEAVAEIASSGQLTARQPGDTGLVVTYRGVVLGVRVLVPSELPNGTAYPFVPQVNFIDREVFAKLRQLNMIPSDLSSDAEFLRRVTIDTIGSLPTPDEVRAFLNDDSSDKRARKIDELLAHPLHAAVWATKLSDITGNNTEAQPNPQYLKARRSQQWHDWLRKRVAENTPYDEIVHGILLATSREGQSPQEWLDSALKIDKEIEKGFATSYPDRDTLDLYWRQANTTVEQRGEKVAAAFLGVRLECAQCHKHPTDRWTQLDYRSFANLFQQVTIGASPETRDLIKKVNDERKENTTAKNNQINVLFEMFMGPGGTVGKNGRPIPNGKTLRHPDTDQPLIPKALGGPELPIESGEDVREKLFEWMVGPENPYFARSFANRIWAHYFGVGLVDPVDDFSVANPPTNPRLLDALAKEFVNRGFDIRYMERLILNSRTYQLSSKPNPTNKLDRNNYSRSFVRPMMAEAVVDILDAALGVSETFGNEAPAGVRMIEVGASRLNNPNLSYVLRIFGRPPRTTACDCERSLDPALPQTLYRMTDPAVLQKLNAPNGRLAQLLKDKNKNDEQVFEELFLSTLNRLPTDADKAAFAQYRASEKSRPAMFQDALWALINTREFILNH